MEKFTVRDVAAWKRVAQNCVKYYTDIQKYENKIADLQNLIEETQTLIDRESYPVYARTGYAVNKLIERKEVVVTKKNSETGEECVVLDADGNPKTALRWVPIYGEDTNFLPPVTNEGSDNDIDTVNVESNITENE